MPDPKRHKFLARGSRKVVTENGTARDKMAHIFYDKLVFLPWLHMLNKHCTPVFHIAQKRLWLLLRWAGIVCVTCGCLWQKRVCPLAGFDLLRSSRILIHGACLRGLRGQLSPLGWVMSFEPWTSKHALSIHDYESTWKKTDISGNARRNPRSKTHIKRSRSLTFVIETSKKNGTSKLSINHKFTSSGVDSQESISECQLMGSQSLNRAPYNR